MRAEDMICLEKVCKDYDNPDRKGSIEALKDFNLSVRRGEFVSLLGPSGCGKTTLINIIAGFIKPTSGKVYFDGQKVSGVDRSRIVVFQEYNLFDWKTVKENIEFGLKTKGLPRSMRIEISRNLIRMVNLAGFEDLYPFELSGGMKQRVALARALAVNPQCILMDEPLGSLDSQMREKLQVEIMSLWHKTKKTILMVTHDIEEAIFLSDRVAVISKETNNIGKIIDIDIPRPRSIEVKDMPLFQEIKRTLREAIS